MCNKLLFTCLPSHRFWRSTLIDLGAPTKNSSGIKNYPPPPRYAYFSACLKTLCPPPPSQILGAPQWFAPPPGKISAGAHVCMYVCVYVCIWVCLCMCVCTHITYIIMYIAILIILSKHTQLKLVASNNMIASIPATQLSHSYFRILGCDPLLLVLRGLRRLPWGTIKSSPTGTRHHSRQSVTTDIRSIQTRAKS